MCVGLLKKVGMDFLPNSKTWHLVSKERPNGGQIFNPLCKAIVLKPDWPNMVQ